MGNVFECNYAELNFWVDNLLSFVQHVDVRTQPLQELIVQLRNCTYSSTDWDSEEQGQQIVTVTNMAEQNYSNMLAQCPPAQRDAPLKYAELLRRVLVLVVLV